MKITWSHALTGAAVALVALTSGTMAQSAFPERTITMVVPFSAGGGSDILGRLVGQKMGEVLGQEVIIENLPGAAGTLGTDTTARAAPDGYTIQLINTIAHSAAAIITPDVQYNSVTSFTGIGAIGDTPYILIENPGFGADYASVVAKLKAEPGVYNFGSAGIGSAPHLVMELFKAQAGVDIVHIPYGGGAPALNDAVAGTVPLIFENVAATELIKAGQLKGLAITGAARSPAFPDIPTFTEVGLPAFDVAAHWGLIGPAGIPDDVLQKLNDALNQALADPKVAEALAGQSITPKSGTAADYNNLLASEAKLWAGVIADAGL